MASGQPVASAMFPASAVMIAGWPVIVATMPSTAPIALSLLIDRMDAATTTFYRFAAVSVAAAARVFCRTLITTDENVMRECRHLKFVASNGNEAMKRSAEGFGAGLAGWLTRRSVRLRPLRVRGDLRRRLPRDHVLRRGHAPHPHRDREHPRGRDHDHDRGRE